MLGRGEWSKMGMLSILQNTVANNIGVSLETAILLVFLMGGFIFYAKSFQIGIIMHFVGSGLIFMLFYALSLNWVAPLVIFFISLVILSFSLYATSKVSQAGGFI